MTYIDLRWFSGMTVFTAADMMCAILGVACDRVKQLRMSCFL